MCVDVNMSRQFLSLVLKAWVWGEFVSQVMPDIGLEYYYVVAGC